MNRQQRIICGLILVFTPHLCFGGYQHIVAMVERLSNEQQTGSHQAIEERVEALSGTANAPQAAPSTPRPTEMTEIELVLFKGITAALTPLMAHYPTEKLIPQAMPNDSCEEKLEYAHVVATFLDRLKKKFETFAPEAHDFIKTKKFALQPLGKTLIATLVTLQHILQRQLEECKNNKQQSATEKELKKVTTSASKNLEALLSDGFGI